jgi:hypothetical protein
MPGRIISKILCLGILLSGEEKETYSGMEQLHPYCKLK